MERRKVDQAGEAAATDPWAAPGEYARVFTCIPWNLGYV